MSNIRIGQVTGGAGGNGGALVDAINKCNCSQILVLEVYTFAVSAASEISCW